MVTQCPSTGLLAFSVCLFKSSVTVKIYSVCRLCWMSFVLFNMSGQDSPEIAPIVPTFSNMFKYVV